MENTILTQIATGQAQKEITINENFVSTSIAGAFAKNPNTTAGLVWGYYGGNVLYDGDIYPITNGTITLTDNSHNYIEADYQGVVSKNTTGFTPGKYALYDVVTADGVVTDYNELRCWVGMPPAVSNRSVNVSDDANFSFTWKEINCQILTLTGAISWAITGTLPSKPWVGVIKNDTTGGYPVIISCGVGTTYTLANGSCELIVCTGSNVFSPAKEQYLDLNFLDSVTWTNMPAAETEMISAGSNYKKRVNLTKATHFRITGNTNTAGASGASFRVQYSTDNTNWYPLGASASSGELVLTSTGLAPATWIAVASGAKVDVILRFVGINGDGAADPIVRALGVQFKYLI